MLLVMAAVAGAQRRVQTLGRGVVAVQNGTDVLVSWRKLAQEPEDVTYNVYVSRSADGNYVQVNSDPLKRSNFKTTTTVVPTGSLVAVRVVNDGVEGDLSVPYSFMNFQLRNVFVDIRFNGSPLANADYSTKYVWPCDLDGDGEMDYVVDRNPNGEGTHKIEAYLRDGTYLWTVDLGPNESISNGQDDQVVAYDLDCDGYGEVMIQSSDGTRFWDKETGTWGKYVNHGETGDTDGDGIIDYESQTTKNPPRYFTVIDGLTGAEKASVEMHYNSAYNRTNKAELKGEEYNKHVGKFCITYLDGIHPAVTMEWHTRSSSGTHYYYDEGFGYDFTSGKAGELKELFLEPCGSGSFHQVRVADVDMDGRDEMIEGGWTMDHMGKVLFNAGIAHGDRFRTSDINPEIPGLETFAIQQNAGDMLGQILYKAENGEAIKKWYLSGVGDVGRGECYDLEPNHLGWEMFSTMNGYQIYDSNGDAIEGETGYFPTEALWWDGDLGREYMAATDGDGLSAYVAKYGTGRLFEISKISGWQVRSVYGARAAFWGDMIGDWREEIILRHYTDGVCDGITGFSTDYATTVDNIYCLLEDPHYRGDCTTKGYYQTPNPGFYLGYGMPRPPLPPVMVTDLVASGSDSYTDYARATTVPYEDGKSVLYDLYTAQDITLSAPMRPSTVYLMPVKGQMIKFSGVGELAGEGDIWKSQNGKVSLSVPVTTSGALYISEGELESDKSINSVVHLRAKGTLSGSPVLLNTVVFEDALNYEGCRLMPHGTMTFKKDLVMKSRVFIELSDSTDCLHVDGNLDVKGGNPVFTVAFDNPGVGRYKLIEYTGEMIGSVNRFSVRGLTGLPYSVVNRDNAVWLVIDEQRAASDNVAWTGSESSVWDYQTPNFTIGAEPTDFVAQDSLVFGDDAVRTDISVSELMPVGGVTFTNNEKTYRITGDGGFSGVGGLVFNGNGRVELSTVHSDYTGATVINSGTVVVKNLADGGAASSLGAASSAASNWQMGRATLVVDNASTSTDRALTLNDSATIQIPNGTSAFKGQICGKGTLIKKGNGQLNYTYAGSNTYSGGTVLAGGAIAMGAWNTTFGAPTSKITTTSNSTITIFNNNSTSQVPSFANALHIEDGVSVTLNGGKRCSVKPTLTGSGTLKVNFPYVRGDFAPNASRFNGTIEVTDGEVRLAAALDLSNGTLQLDADNYVYNNSGTHKVGALNGTNVGAQIASGTWNIGFLGTDCSFAGTFVSGTTVNKYGEGKLTLTGSSDAPMNVYLGSLDIENTAAPTTTKTITVNEGAILMGAGQTASVVVNAGGSIHAGKGTLFTGDITLTGTLKVNKNGRIRVRGRSTSDKTDHFNVAGNITLDSPVFVMERLGNDWMPDMEYQVFTGEGKITLKGTPTFEPTVPADGYMWDYSKLASDGVLIVVAAPTAIDGISVDGQNGQDVYDLQGRKVEHPTKGLYIVNGQKVLMDE